MLDGCLRDIWAIFIANQLLCVCQLWYTWCTTQSCYDWFIVFTLIENLNQQIGSSFAWASTAFSSSTFKFVEWQLLHNCSNLFSSTHVWSRILKNVFLRLRLILEHWINNLKTHKKACTLGIIIFYLTRVYDSSISDA